MIQFYVWTLNFVKKRSHRQNDLQSQAIYDDNFLFKKSLHILEDGASGVQAGDIEQMIVWNYF